MQNLSGFVGPILIGAVVEGSGGVWSAATLSLIVAGILGIIASISMFGMVMNKKASGQSSQFSSFLNKETGAA